MSVVVVGKADGSVVEAVIENIRLSHPSVVKLDIGPEQVARFEQSGQDLVLVLVNGQTVRITDFFVVEDGVRSELILRDDNQVLWWGQYHQPWADFHFAEINLVDEAAAFVPLNDGGINWWLPLLALVGVGGAIAASSGSSGSDDVAPTQPSKPVVTDTSVTGGGQGALIIGGKTDPSFEGSKVGVVDGNGQPVIDPDTGKPVEGIVGPNGEIKIQVPEGAIPDGTVPSIVVTPPTGEASDPAPAPVVRPDAPDVSIDPIVPGTGEQTEITGKITKVPEGGKPQVVVTVGGKPVPTENLVVTGPDANGDYTWTAKVPTADLPQDTTVEVVGKTQDPKTGLVSGPSQPADETVPDTTAPNVVVTIDEDGNVTFQFSETPKGFDPSDVKVTGATLVQDSLVQDATDPTKWTAKVSPTPGADGADVPVKVTVPADSYTDEAGNSGKQGEDDQTFKAPAAPEVSIDPIVTGTGDETEITGKITKVPEGGKPQVVVTVGGKPVPTDDIVVTGPDANGDYTWTAKVPTADLPQDTTVEVVGKTQDPKTGLVSGPSQPADEQVPDTTAPTVTVTINEDGTVTFKFSEDVKGFDGADIEVAGARLAPGSLQGSGDTWTAGLLNASKGTTILVKVKEGSYTDLADNAGAAGQDKSITVKIDSVIPTDGGGALISGRTEPGNAVTVSLPDGSLLGPVTADANGNWNVSSATHPGDKGQIQATTSNQDGDDVSDQVSLPIVTIDVVASDDVINDGEWTGLVDAGNVKLTGTSSNAKAKVVVTFNGKTYETQPDADGKWSVDVPAADVKEGGDNEITAVAKVTTPDGEVDSAIATRPFSKDTQPPAVDVEIRQDGSVIFTFTEEVTGFDASSVTVANGSLSNLQRDPADPTKWTANWTADADTEGDLVITVPQGSYTDLASNPGSAGDDSTAVDTKAPTVEITVDDQGNVTFQFSEEPDGFAETDITLTGASLVPDSLVQDATDPTKWTAKVVPVPGADGADVPVKATVPAGSYTDKAGNAGGQGEGNQTFKAPPAPDVSLDGPIVPGSGSTTPVTGKITVPAGTAPQDVFVKIGDGSPITVPAGQLEKQPDGSYTFKVDVPTSALTPGVTVDAGAKVKDPATGLVSQPGDADNVPVTQAPEVQYPTITITDTDGVIARNDDGTINVKGTSTNAQHVKVTIGSTQHIVDVDANGNWELTNVPLTDAEQKNELIITATVVDKNGDAVLDANGQVVSDTTMAPAVPDTPSVDVTIDPETGLVTLKFSDVPNDANGTPLTAAQIKELAIITGGTVPGDYATKDGGLTWTAKVVPTKPGDVKVEVPAGSYHDGNGTAGTGDVDTQAFVAPKATISVDVEAGAPFIPGKGYTLKIGFDKNIDPATLSLADIKVFVGDETQPSTTAGAITDLEQNADGTWSAVFTPAETERGKELTFKIVNGDYKGANGLDGLGAESSPPILVNTPPALKLELNVEEGPVTYLPGEDLSGFDGNENWENHWDTTYGGIWPDVNKNVGFLDMRADGGTHEQTLKTPTVFAKGDVLEFLTGWNNGWAGTDDGGQSTLEYLYGGQRLLLITTPDKSPSGTPQNSEYDAEQRFAKISLGDGIEVSLDGGKTWLDGSSEILFETWRPVQADVNVTLDQLTGILVRGMPIGQTDGKIGMRWEAAANPADDFQVASIKVRKPADGGEPGNENGDKAIAYDPDAATGTDPTLALFKTLKVEEVDSTQAITQATITLGNYQEGDLVWLAGTATNGALNRQGMFDNVKYSISTEGGTLVLTLDAQSELDVDGWNAVLANIRFGSTSDTASERTVSFQVSDGYESSNIEQVAIDVRSGAEEGVPTLMPVVSPAMTVFSTDDIDFDQLDVLDDSEDPAAQQFTAKLFSLSVNDLLKADASDDEIDLSGIVSSDAIGQSATPVTAVATMSPSDLAEYVAPHNPLEDELLQPQLAHV